MRFRVTNIRPGYCEVWANRYDGGRYECIANVRRLDNDSWHWAATDYYLLPEDNFVAQGTRRDCVNDCQRTALVRQMERAIDRQPKESKHWCSPRRMALADMERSHLFGPDELDGWRERARTFGEVSA